MPKLSKRQRSIKLRDVQQPHSQFKSDFNAVYEALRNKLGGGAPITITEASLIPVIMASIRLVEHMTKSTKEPGQGKKDLVMALLTALIADSDLDEDAKIFLQQILESVGPSVIDGLIDADHGKLFESAWAKLRAACFCCAKPAA